MEGENQIKSLIKLWLSVQASLCYCYFISSKIPKGKLRVLSLLPIFYLFAILPLHLSSVLATGIAFFFITWLASFKLLLFSFDLAPLCPDPPKSLLLFILIACFPIKIKQNQQYPSSHDTRSPPKLPLNSAAKALLLALLVNVNDHKPHLHPKIILVLCCCEAYLLVDILVGTCSALVRALTGLELEPPSDEPYLSISLQDFWGRRWNLMATNALRHTIYEPVKSISATVTGRRWAPLPAAMAAFLVSGLMHELLVYYVTRVTPTWEATGFFLLHGACWAAELAAKKALTGRWQLHWAVSGPLTVAFVATTSGWFFFPLVRHGADVRAIGEYRALVGCVKGILP